MNVTVEEYMTKTKTSLKEEADKLKSDIEQEGKAHLKLSEIEKKDFVAAWSSPSTISISNLKN